MRVYDRVKVARDPNRLISSQLIDLLCDNFIELHGDRLFGDDSAVIGGLGSINGEIFTIIAQEKGDTLENKMERNFGMAQPEGFRKANRLIKQAEKFNRPIITLIDTAGAYPGIEAEERGQAEAIANLLYTLSDIKVPVISIVISEGGSGGALALGVCDHTLMFENAFYSVISPEGFASILYKGKKTVEEVVETMKITADDMVEMGICDEIIKEPKTQLNKKSFQFQADDLKARIIEITKEKRKLSKTVLVNKRNEKLLRAEKLC
jgi:acetyl-CoA carboxylase carboxyl transferase subunit alpha